MDPIAIQFPIIPAGEQTATVLNDDVIEEILTRAPAKTVIYLKSACKFWQRRLDDPFFARIHFSRATLCPLLITGGTEVYRPCRIMHLVEGSHLDSRTCVISRFDIRTRAAREQSSKFQGFQFQLNTNATSCEGLLSWPAYDQNRAPCIIISNPITREYVSLSWPVDEDLGYAFVGMGFRRETKKFELLRMAADPDDFDEGDPLWWPEVRVVGDSSWRRVAGGTRTPQLIPISQVVYVDGTIYWTYFDTLAICCFNFDTRALFEVEDMPEIIFPPVSMGDLGSLGVLDGALCLSQIVHRDGHVEVFVLVDGLQWKKLYDIETKITYMEHMGVLWPRCEYKAIKRLSSGEILMHDWRGKFIIYDPLTKQEKRVCLLDESRLARYDGLHHNLEVLSHLPCLVRLKEALNVDQLQVQLWNL